MATSGPNYPSTGGTNFVFGVWDWDNPSNITADDSSYATATLYPECEDDGRQTYELRGTAYGFSIPSGATIDGIEVVINKLGGAGDSWILDQEVKLIKAGSTVGDNKADASLWNDSTLASTTYGGTTDLWGTTWTHSDVNASNFGVSLIAYAEGSGSVATVDFITVKIYYTSGGSGSSGTGIGSRFFMMF